MINFTRSFKIQPISNFFLFLLYYQLVLCRLNSNFRNPKKSKIFYVFNKYFYFFKKGGHVGITLQYLYYLLD